MGHPLLPDVDSVRTGQSGESLKINTIIYTVELRIIYGSGSSIKSFVAIMCMHRELLKYGIQYFFFNLLVTVCGC